MINPIWKKQELFTITEAAYVLADIEPGLPSAELPPAAVLTLKRILSVFREGGLRAVWDRHAMEQYNAGWLRQACDGVLSGNEPINNDFFSRYTLTRDEVFSLADEPPPDSGEKPGALSVNVPGAVNWRDLELTIRDNEYSEVLEIKGPGGFMLNCKPSEYGLKGRKLWAMFKIFADGNGVVAPAKVIDNVKPTVSRLRKALKSMFPDLPGDPIPWSPRERAWKTAFPVSASIYSEED
jgi:hypothetical protein